MADDRDYMRDENPHQGASHSFGKNLGAAQTTDRERTIESGRETGRAGTPAKQSSTAPARGPVSGPFTLMRRLSDDMDRLFENLGFGRAVGLGAPADRALWRGTSAEADAAWLPQVETFRRDDKLVIRADLPGAKRDDVKVEIENGVLTISGHRASEREETRDEFYRSERSYGTFYRAIPLPEGVESDNCDATFQDGVLEITLPAPKLAERRARQIPVR
jgi:HSP20 family protein